MLGASQVAEIGGLPAALVRPPPISLAARSRNPTAGRRLFAHRRDIRFPPINRRRAGVPPENFA